MTNPNGANQYQMDPRQKLCWESYINPKSETFGNAYQSAVKAGYSEGYAQSITDENWFTEKLRRLNMLGKAESTLEKTLNYEPVNEEGRIDTALLRTQTDVAKFIAERLGKEHYSSRQEVTGKDGEALNDKEVTEEIKNLAQQLNELKRSNNRTSLSSDGVDTNPLGN